MFENPSTLDAYDARMAFDGKNYISTRIVGYPGVLYDMLTVARENNILSALPCAYYRAAHLYNVRQPAFSAPEGCIYLHSSQESLFAGITRQDGTSSSLAPIDQQRCILGREKLIRAQTQEGCTLGWLREWDSDSCTDPAGCNKWRASMLRKYLDHLAPWALTPFIAFRTTVCASCGKHIEQSMLGGRKKIWEDLPSYFDLPPWSELKNGL